MGVYQTPNRTFLIQRVVDYTPANFMRCLKLLSCAVLLMANGCISFNALSTFVDPETHVVLTNQFKGVFLVATTTAQNIEVAYRTKTTSKLFGAKAVETTGDVEMVKALSALVAQSAALGAKGAGLP